MQPIQPPVTPNSPTTQVAQLQDALALLLERDIYRFDADRRARFLDGVQGERGRYGDFTQKLVGVFQEQHQIPVFGAVDETTAKALNAVLRELGALDPENDLTGVVKALDAQSRTLSAINTGTDRLISIDEKLSALGRLPELALNMRGDAVRALQTQLVQIGVDLPASETDNRLFGVGTQEALRQLQQKYDLAQTGRFDEATRAALATLAASASQPRRVEGRILLDNGLPAAGVRLRVVHKGFGEAETALGEIETDARGYYALQYGNDAATANLEVQALDPAGNVVRLSAPVVDAERSTVLNLVAPTGVRSQTSEYGLMTTDLARSVGDDLTRLAQTREDDTRQDLTLLHDSSGWDARLITLAAQSVRTSAETGLPPAALYGALRAGLPADATALADVSEEAFAAALAHATQAGIVALDGPAREAAQKTFREFRRATLRTLKAPGAVSSLGDLLDTAVVDAPHRATFERLALTHTDDEPGALWDAARAEGIPDDQIAHLQLQGKLAFLTLNNASLAADLQRVVQSPDQLERLVAEDLYDAATWTRRLEALASENGVVNSERLTALIPPAYSQADLPARLNAYSEDMARQVRQTYPTQVVSRRIETDALKLGTQHAELKTPVQTFLRTAAGAGFELGRVPVSQYLTQQGEAAFTGLTAEQRPLAEEGVRLLTRVYQMTPNDESMSVLLDLGFTSAWQVAAIARSEFVERYWERFGSRTVAERVWEKSSQITSVTFNVFTLAKKIESTPPVLALSGSPEQYSQAKESLGLLLKDYPTLESLFGSLDFCDCEHCRSVLSPAAYLVDLLRFLDPAEPVWAQALVDWKNKHAGKAYDGPEFNFLKPYDALVLRRPDLPHQALTCENTNTVVPYIDLVNEILEYYVANGKLEAAAAQDTGSATSAELAAEPQTLVPAAYDMLRQARYPLTLPFDLWLEIARRFCDHFDVPFWRVLEAFRPRETLFPPTADPTDYARAQVWLEQLGLTSDEAALITDSTFADWPKLFGFDTETDGQALARLTSAKTLAERLGVTYRELVDLVQTDFINPRLNELRILQTLDLTVSDVVAYKNGALSAEDTSGFEKRLTTITQAYQATVPGFDAATWIDDAWTNGAFAQALLLRDADAGCTFEKTELSRGDGGALAALDVLRFNLFVRLWRRLGWSLSETDQALRVCLPTGVALDLTTLGQALQTALIHLAHLKELGELLPLGRNGRLALTTLWADLPARGRQSLYAQSFLTRAILKDDPAFDHPLGLYLSTPGVALKDHLSAVQAALGLTTDEVALILADGNTGAERAVATAALSLANVSLLYRYRFLARALKVSVAELIDLKTLSGLDPFTPLHAGVLTDLGDDHAFGQTLAFVRGVQAVKNGQLTVTDLTYLFRDRFDPAGPFRLDAAGPGDALRALATSLRTLANDFAVPIDALDLTDEALKTKMLLVFAPDVVEGFMGFWTDQAVYSATATPVAPARRLSPTLYSLPGISLVYDETRQRQQVSHLGVLTGPARAALLAQVPQPDPGNADAVAARQTFSDLLDVIVAKSNTQFKQFFDAHFDGLLEFDDFFGAGVVATPEEKRLGLLKVILPYLHRRLARLAVVGAVSGAIGADPALLTVLLTDPALLSLPEQNTRPLVDGLAALGQGGWSAQTFADPGFGGAVQETITSTVAVVAGTANSGRWRAVVEVPVGGAYRFYIRLGKANATARVHCASATDPVVVGTAAAAEAEFSGFIELQPGQAVGFTVEVDNLQGGGFELSVKGETTTRVGLEQAPFAAVPQLILDDALRATRLTSKAARLALALGLSPRELRHILTHGADFGGADFRLLPTKPNDAQAPTLWRTYQALLTYQALKQAWSPENDDLIGVFETARRLPAPTLAALAKQLAELSRRSEETVSDTAMALKLNSAAALADVTGQSRLWQALQILETFGIRMEALKGWLSVRPDAVVARRVRDAIKSRYEPAAWLQIAKSIYDPLRARRRDALVAHILHQTPELDSVERLFEYFLIDPAMEPVVQTSRLRLAISALQTFIQRCFLNLEPRVHPSMLNGQHWAWMKRYRVWEANRKIFLYPENWLEPEWRDDKTHLYQELESKLLQGDVTTELAEDALHGYLRKLDQLARLEVVTMYAEEKPLAPTTLHVVARTYTQPRQYFYRRYDHQMWTPWEPITVEIEGDHLAAVIWRERLHLFWLTFMEKVESAGKPRTNEQGNLGSLPMSKLVSAAGSTAEGAAARTLDVQLSWSEYFQGEWTERASGGFGNVITPAQGFDPAAIFLSVGKEFDSESGVESALWINLHGLLGVEKMMIAGQSVAAGLGAMMNVGGGLQGISIQLGESYFTPAFRVVGKNSPPQYTSTSQAIISPYSPAGRRFNTYVSSGALAVSFVQKVVTTDGARKADPPAPQTILSKGGGYSILPASNRPTLPNAEFAPLLSPVFYADEVNTFFVEPSLTETTIDKWEGYALPRPSQKPKWSDFVDRLPDLNVVIPPKYYQDPFKVHPGDPRPEVIDPRALHALKTNPDRLTQSGVVVQFGDALISGTGRVRDAVSAGVTQVVTHVGGAL